MSVLTKEKKNGGSFSNLLCAPYFSTCTIQFIMCFLSVFPEQEHQVYLVDEDSLEGVTKHIGILVECIYCCIK